MPHTFCGQEYCSANGASCPKASELPTLMQAVGELHETPDKLLCGELGGPWKSGTDQVVPFQLSASAAVELSPVLNPTALQAVLPLAETQDTLENPLAVLPAGTTTFCGVHLVPFQRSASGTLLVPLKNEPTAVQAFGAVHESPCRAGSEPPAGMGAFWMVQFVPFHASAQVWPVAEPTAVHAVAELHDTSLSWLVVDPDGLGLGWMVQLVPSQRSASVRWSPAESS
jgi:hypothetical protein